MSFSLQLVRFLSHCMLDNGRLKLTCYFLCILMQCYPAKVLFESFSFDSNGLNPDKFEKICPAMVEQIESKACLVENDKKNNKYVKQGKAQGTYTCMYMCTLGFHS